MGAIDSVVPAFALPELSPGLIRDLISRALAVAIVSVLEPMSVARAVAVRSGQMIEANREFVGQGAAEFVGSFFQCYIAPASFTRSGVNQDAAALGRQPGGAPARKVG